MKHGKKYVAAKAMVEKGKIYDVAEAVSLAKKASYSKF